MAYVYSHNRLDKNEVFYIGIGSDSNNKYSRAYNTIDRSKFWKSIVNKTKYVVHILFDNVSWEDACQKEKDLIKMHGRKDLGTGTLVNMTNGGEGILGYIFTENDKIKISNSKKGKLSHRKGKKLSELYINNLTGKKRPEFSKEWKEKMSISRTGKKRAPFTEEHKKNISKSKKIKIKCPYCNLESNISNMKRYHFNKCKYKINT
jgi:hypothetical protein